MAKLAVIASKATGREITHVAATDGDWHDAVVAQGTPAPMADMLLGMYGAARRSKRFYVAPRGQCATYVPPCSNPMRERIHSGLVGVVGKCGLSVRNAYRESITHAFGRHFVTETMLCER